MKDETTLYRFFDPEGKLLYVGITGALSVRFMNHAATKLWWPEVEMIRLETYPRRYQAVIAERLAIRHENPLHNIQRPRALQGTPGWRSLVARSATAPTASKIQNFRCDPDLWARFGAVADPDRSAALRAFIAWYVREPGAKMPKRP